MRHVFTIVSTLTVLALSASADAQSGYSIQLNASAGGYYYYGFGNTQYYNLYPSFSATLNGSATTSEIHFRSPQQDYEGYFNTSNGNGASSFVEPNTGTTVSRANGTWDLEILQGSNTYHYNVGVSLTLPFANLPRITSPELLNGQPYSGTVHFGLADGNAQYPGASTTYFTYIYGGSDTYYGSATLPAGSTTWTPNADLSSESTARFTIQTQNGAIDSTALTITSITPVTPNAPAVSFAAPTITYTSYLEASIPVPEPTTAALMLLSGLALRRRRA